MEFLKKQEKTAILLIAPETGRLWENMGPLARYISGKSGGLGEVIAALSGGLTERGIECHLATPNLKKRFQKESNIDEEAWQAMRRCTDPERIHLVNSSIFAHLPSVYAGNPLLNAAEFQRQLVNSVIANLRAQNGGRLIIHSHDWMAGGVITAYAKLRGCPVLHTIHNIHTGQIPIDMLFGVGMERMMPYLFLLNGSGPYRLDSQATAIKNSNLVSFVGWRFLREIIEDHFTDALFSPAVCREIKIKYDHGATLTILNAPSPNLYPERCRHLAVPFGPDDAILSAKRENRMAFQRQTGLQVDPEAILLYWPSRLDPTQKGIHLLEDIAQRFVIEHGDVQIAIVGDGVGNDRVHEEYCGRIAWSSGGKISYHRFNESLSMLGFAAASDVFGASLYEPCGQIDQVGNLCLSSATSDDGGCGSVSAK
ncbi:MAG: glycogen/starch synthase, partial [Syntrophales bacterium LBB04]|nr:glycogen/starch synthase [Syntrophales bacterium LBB04]